MKRKEEEMNERESKRVGEERGKKIAKEA